MADRAVPTMRRRATRPAHDRAREGGDGCGERRAAPSDMLRAEAVFMASAIMAAVTALWRMVAGFQSFTGVNVCLYCHARRSRRPHRCMHRSKDITCKVTGKAQFKATLER